ncbi:FG-GAP-like repeat-containing protein [Myxococcus sp. Y35]|uniref:FG-GAP-like repeat-containing protein n=1 Tax=Pseudomyxococcus flavus TaxID=3115648 RepID=UPI003CF8662E
MAPLLTSSPGASLVQVHAEAQQHWAAMKSQGPVTYRVAPVCPSCTDVVPSQESNGKSPGRIRGGGNVTPDGAATYSIPLWVSPGRAGIQPQLALQYSSRQGDGFLGVGFSLSGLSQISRCRRTVAQDGEAEAVQFDASDRFCLDGNRLVAIAGVYGAHGTEYRTENNIFARIVSLNPDEMGPTTFEVYLKDGRILTFGGGPESRVEAPRARLRPVSLGNVDFQYPSWGRLSWSVSQMRDRSGNALRVQYGALRDAGVDEALEHWPEEIVYTESSVQGAPAASRSVRFVYENRPDVAEQFVNGLKLRRSRRLVRLEMRGPNPVHPSLLRSYRLVYGTPSISKRSVLTELYECDGAGVCTAPTRFEWTPGSWEFEAVNTGISDATVSPGYARAEGIWMLYTPDINGDGRDDLLYREFVSGTTGSGGYGRWWVRLSTGNGFGPREPANLPNNSYEGRLDAGRPIDFNLDGRVDFVNMAYRESDSWRHYRLYRSTGTGFAWDGTDHESSRMWLYSGAPQSPTFYAADLNGDGLPDAVRSITASSSGGYHVWGYRLNSEGTLSAYSELPIQASSEGLAQFADVDGSGRTALLTSDHLTSNAYYYTAVMLGADNAVVRKPTALMTTQWDALRHWFADINGDGLADAISVPFYGGDPRISLNTGNGFLPHRTQTLSPEFQFGDMDAGLGGNESGVRVDDFNGDGRADVAIASSHISPASRQHWVVLESNGREFRPRALPIPLGMKAREGWKMHQLLDVNGDGLRDIVQPENGTLRLYIRKGLKPDMLVRVRDGLGARVEFDYKPLSDSSVYTPGVVPELPQFRVTRGLWVVSEHRVEDGLLGLQAFRHRYIDGRADLQGRGWLGFATHVVTNARTGGEQLTRYGVSIRVGTAWPYANRPVFEQRTLMLESGRYMRQSRWTEYELHTEAQGKVRFPWANYQLEAHLEWEGGSSPESGEVTFGTKLDYAYDTDGNPTYSRRRSLFAGVETGDEEEWSAQYDRWPDRWLIGRPRSEQVTSRTSSGAAVSRRVSSTHSPSTGLLATQTVEEGDANLQLRTVIERDIFGQATRVTSTDASGRSRYTMAAYDSQDEMFPVTITNSLGQRTELAYHPGLGAQVARTEVNGVRTRWRYDGFGRVRWEGRADGSHVSVAYASGIPTGASFTSSSVSLSFSDGARSRHDFDLLDRPVGTERTGADGAPVYKMTGYDALGRVRQVWAPYSAGDPIVTTEYEYDRSGRLLFARHGDGTFEEYRYSTLVTEAWDARRNYTRAIRDARGRPLEYRQEGGHQSHTGTRFTYGPFDLPVKAEQFVDNVIRNVTEFQYDKLGNRTLLLEPNSATPYREDLVYNGFGDVVRRTDASGAITTYEYDLLGRITLESGPGGDTKFVWDSASGNGIGQLASAVSPEGVATAYSYDALGRLEQSQWLIDGRYYRLNQSYDTQGRLDVLSYPEVPGQARFEVKHTYSPWGALKDVRAVSNGHVYWTAEARTATGLLKTERFGNNVTSSRMYDPTRGVLRRIDTTLASTVVQALAYDFDANGNLATRGDEVTGVSESFGYDHLDRLVAWTVQAPTRRSVHAFRYDGLGNLLGRDVLEGDGTPYSLTYDTSMGFGPFAVTHSTWGTYSYDANGNQVTAPGRQVAYTPFGLPSRIIQTSDVLTFQYSAFQTRALKRSSTGAQTSYVEGLYEHRRDGALGEHVFHIQGDGRGVAQVVWKEENGVITDTSTLYLHGDLLGSVDTVTDESGLVVERLKYDVMGARALASNPALPAVGTNAKLRHGFTGHEHEDESGLINMRGRIYDPKIGRFLSRDPLVQFPDFSQSYNRYTYALGNPLKWTDPSGFSNAKVSVADVRDAIVTPNAGTTVVDGKVVPYDTVTFVEGGEGGDVGVEGGGSDDDGFSSPSASEYSAGGNSPGAGNSPSAGDTPGPRGQPGNKGPTVSSMAPYEWAGRIEKTETYLHVKNYAEGYATANPLLQMWIPYAVSAGFAGTALGLVEGLKLGTGTAAAMDATGADMAVPILEDVVRFSTVFNALGGLRGGALGMAAKASVNWKSVKTFQHTFKKHGEGAKITRSLTDTARGTGKPQGQWLDNEAAAELLHSHRAGLDGPASIRIPEGLGQVIMPDGSVVGATRATLVPGPNGLVTAYPIP